MADAAAGHVGLGEHVYQSIGYLLHAGTAEVYNRSSGSIELLTITQAMPGILIRPVKTLVDEIPIIDLRDDEAMKPYLTWFKHQDLPMQRASFGGRHREVSFWEIDVKLGAVELRDYERIEGMIAGLLGRYSNGLDIYFWHQASAGAAPSRGDIIAQAIISDVQVVPRVEIATARGEDGYIVVNFNLAYWKEEGT